MSILDKFCGVADNYNKRSPATSIVASKLTKAEPIFTVGSSYIGDLPNNLNPGDLVSDSSGNLIIGTENGGPKTGPSPINASDIFGDLSTITTTTSFIKSDKTYRLSAELNTKDLMFIKDRIEEKYSYIKIKNLDELKQAFERLECFISDSEVVTTISYFKLECGKYVVIN